MMRSLPIFTLGLFCLTACSWHDFGQHEHGINSDPPEISNEAACADLLAGVRHAESGELNSNAISLLNWNTQKHNHTDLHRDLMEFSKEADLVLLQEAVVDADHLTQLEGGLYWNFAPGYIKKGIATGVMTASKVRPAAYCKLASTEPWLGSPKATSLTTYNLKDNSENLLVINIHLINFTFGTAAMEQQLSDALAYIDAHTGPVILAGDMNTWSNRRQNAAAARLAKRGLTPVSFDTDRRTRIFGLPVDHIYVRNLDWSKAETHTVSSSDHNPLEVLLNGAEK